MAALQEKVDLAASMVSERSYLAAHGNLDTREIKDLTKWELQQALLLVKAYSIANKAKKKKHFTIGAL